MRASAFVALWSAALLTGTVAQSATPPLSPPSQGGDRGGGRRDKITPICIHPENPKYFLFRGKPLVLITATEHYGSVLNRAFDFEKYLADAADKKMTLTRTFLLFRELQTPRNPTSPCKPESPDYVAPYPRTGPGKALDGEPIFDLDQWNPEYFDRLHRFLRKAAQHGIIVELTLFSSAYGDHIWALNPLRAQNNKQRVGKVPWSAYTSLRDSSLVERQRAYVRKIIQETSAYDNVYYEICNEPGVGLKEWAPAAEADAWQTEMARVIREELAKQRRNHLVFGSEAFISPPKVAHKLDDSFSGNLVDAVNVHPLPFVVLGGRRYQLGYPQSKELALTALRDFCLAAHAQRKPCVLDEDNAAALYCDESGWTVHRKRAWTAVMSAAHYDYIDHSLIVGREAGTPASQRGIRTWMKHLSEFIHGFDFVHAQPLADWINEKPRHLVVSALAVAGKDYAAYLADAREIADAAAGEPVEGKISVILPPGRFRVSLYSPVTGVYSPAMYVEGGKTTTVDLPPFRHDVVLRASRAD